MPKFLLVLSVHTDGDVVFRILTSKAYGRPKVPPCYHGDPFSGFYLGVLKPGGALADDSWLDLRETEDFDRIDFAHLATDGVLTHAHTLSKAEFCPVLACAAAAPDTTIRQRNAFINLRQILDCPH